MDKTENRVSKWRGIKKFIRQQNRDKKLVINPSKINLEETKRSFNKRDTLYQSTQSVNFQKK